MKVIIRLFSLFLLLFTITNPVAASNFSLGAWHTSGSQMWRTSFPPGGASELYYPHSGKYILGNYARPLSPKRELRIEGGIMSDIRSAAGSDSDWDYSTSDDLWYYGEFKTGGNSYFVKIDQTEQINKNTEIFYGYEYRRNHYSMTDGLYTIENYTQVNNPLPALNSTYNMTYQGPYIGVTAKTNIAPQLTVVGSLSYTPIAFAQGSGWWNLRGISFEHTGPAQMLDGKIGLRADLGSDNQGSVTVGYRFQRYSLLHSGTENTSSSISWDKAVNIQKGLYITGEIKF